LEKKFLETKPINVFQKRDSENQKSVQKNPNLERCYGNENSE